MAIQFRCDNCGKALKTDDSKAGKQVNCPGCMKMIRIPDPVGETYGGVANRRQVEEDDNPFRSPQSLDAFDADRNNLEFDDTTLADPGRRFLGAILDNIVGCLFCLPGLFVMGAAGLFDENPNPPTPLGIVGYVVLLLGILIWGGINIYLLAVRSQSIAKYLMRMQIRDYQTKQPASFAKCAVLRSFVNGLIGAVPCVGAIYSIVDALFIFSAEHRCLHDQLAGTYVVNIS